MKASDYIAEFLLNWGVRHVFGMTGGMVTHLLDAIHQKGRIQIVTMHHEQGAAFAAEASARLTRIPGVAFATSGPGATNLITGIGSCYFDSTPAVFITGQVNRNELKKNSPIRQLGFQETDIVSIVRPITKAAWLVEDPEQLPTLLSNAFDLAANGRPGPVLLDIPMDVQKADISPVEKGGLAKVEECFSSTEQIDAFLGALKDSNRPLILAGGGLRASGSVDVFRDVANRLRAPVVYSLMGVDVLPYEHDLRVGMIGTYGNRWANLALAECDLLWVLGSRLDIRQTGSRLETFSEKTIVHVDCDAGEINNRLKKCLPVISDLGPFLADLKTRFENGSFFFKDTEEWRQCIYNWRRDYCDTKELNVVAGIHPNVFMHQLSKRFVQATAFVADVGQHQMWAAQSLELGPHQRFLTSGGMGSMGFALPAAIGAAFSMPEAPVVMIAGDGGFQCNIQELETIVRNKLPIKLIVIDNRGLGMVRQFQKDYFEGRYIGTDWGYSAPDFCKICDAYGISTRKVSRSGEVEDALAWLLADAKSAGLLQVMINEDMDIYPKVAFGRPINAMHPMRA